MRTHLLAAFALLLGSSSAAFASPVAPRSNKADNAVNCECPGPGCPADAPPPKECRTAEARQVCPDPGCGKIPPLVNDTECACPGPGCPAGGWENPDLSDEARKCYGKAVKLRDKRLALCLKQGFCETQEARSASTANDPECPCPGPGCPAGGFQPSDSVDPAAAKCAEKSARALEKPQRRWDKAKKVLERVETAPFLP